MIKKILFVDDDDSILDAAKTALEAYGYEVITAQSGMECLEKIGEADIVFLDIKMPGMNGIEVLRKIKKRNPTMPVVMITAYATVDTAIEAMKEGAFDYIRKPFDIEELEGSVLAAIEEIKFEGLKKIEFEEEDCFEKFRKIVKKRKGIWITKEEDKIGDIEHVSIISMIEQWKPKSLDRLKEEITKFFEKNIAVLITNIEYLFEGNSAVEVRNFLEWVYRNVSLNKGILILSADLKNVDNAKKNEIQDVIADIHLGMISDSISNYLRRQIIQLLSNEEKYSFTKIAQILDIKDNPKLSFHLKKLKDDGVIEQDNEKRYFLSRVGKEIANILQSIREQKLNKKENLLWLPSK
ncbi:MAG: response regulator [Thermoplasmata archaeon]|nr:MAG: response regulator [Thermoplasmata archaeon]